MRQVHYYVSIFPVASLIFTIILQGISIRTLHIRKQRFREGRVPAHIWETIVATL